LVLYSRDIRWLAAALYAVRLVAMPREFSAIEIAEGALLADIAVLAQIFAIYLPIFDLVARLVIAVVFAVLVLRRSFAIGMISTVVACFIITVLSGLMFIAPLLLTCGAGLFLGFTMKRRLAHLPLILLGMTSGMMTLWAMLVLFTLLAGLPLSILARQLELAYKSGVALADWLTVQIGLGVWWRQTAMPILAPIAQLGLAYWWALFPLALWLFLGPVVLLMYSSTNLAVRLLGYDVRPFPGARLERVLAWAVRLPLRLWRRLRRRGS
jgi:hypothetical protein